jgi:hypothetical protein
MNENDRQEFMDIMNGAPTEIQEALGLLMGGALERTGWDSPAQAVADMIEPLHDLTLNHITIEQATAHLMDRICTNAARTHTAAKFYAGGLIGQLQDLAGGDFAGLDAVVVGPDGEPCADTIGNAVAHAAEAAARGRFDMITDILNGMDRYEQMAVVTGLFRMDYDLGRQRMEKDGVRFDDDGNRIMPEIADWADTDVPDADDPFWQK